MLAIIQKGHGTWNIAVSFRYTQLLHRNNQCFRNVLTRCFGASSPPHFSYLKEIKSSLVVSLSINQEAGTGKHRVGQVGSVQLGSRSGLLVKFRTGRACRMRDTDRSGKRRHRYGTVKETLRKRHCSRLRVSSNVAPPSHSVSLISPKTRQSECAVNKDSLIEHIAVELPVKIDYSASVSIR